MSEYPYNPARNSQRKSESENLPPNRSRQEEEKSDDQAPDIWEVIKERKQKGLWDGEITTHEIKEFNLTAGKHFYEMEDVRKRTIVCTTCAIRHGGILEAKLLTQYRLENGVLYLKDEPVNQTP